jgi:hypothetical protein
MRLKYRYITWVIILILSLSMCSYKWGLDDGNVLKHVTDFSKLGKEYTPCDRKMYIYTKIQYCIKRYLSKTLSPI